MDGWLTRGHIVAYLYERGFSVDAGDPLSFIRGNEVVALDDAELVHIPSIREDIERRAWIDEWESQELMDDLQSLAYDDDN